MDDGIMDGQKTEDIGEDNSLSPKHPDMAQGRGKVPISITEPG